jgi:transposase
LQFGISRKPFTTLFCKKPKKVNRSGLTWERVQELIERAGYPFLKKYFENECDGRPTRELALENINRLLSFVENAHKSPFERDCNG